MNHSTDGALPLHVPAAVFAYYKALARGASEDEATAVCMATAAAERRRRDTPTRLLPAVVA